MIDRRAASDCSNHPRVVSENQLGACELVVETLARGGIVAFPTDTVYALAASLDSPTALTRLYQSKQRPSSKPIPVLLASISNLGQIARPINDRTRAFLTTLWPGAVTVVLPARDDAPAEVSGAGAGGNRTVAVRVPAHALARNIIRDAGGAIAATSANISDQPPGRTAADVAGRLGEGVDLILDGGPARSGVASTVVALEPSGPVVLRAGALTASELTVLWRTSSTRSA